MNPAFKEEELERARQETLDNLTVSLRQPATVARYAHHAAAVRRWRPTARHRRRNPSQR